MNGHITERGTEVTESPDETLSYARSDTLWLAALDTRPEVLTYKQRSYDLLDLRPGATLLDVGCGTGSDLRALASSLAPGGHAYGIDQSRRSVATAREALLQSPPLATVTITFDEGRAEHLEFATDSIDVVRVDRVLQHVALPREVLREIYRVLRPGGQVVLVEPDWRTVTVYPGSPLGGGDDHTIAAILAWHVHHTVHPLIGRQLPAILHDTGFAAIDVAANVTISQSYEFANLALELYDAAINDVQSSHSTLTMAEIEAWVLAAQEAEASGRFFASLQHIYATGRKPDHKRYPAPPQRVRRSWGPGLAS